MLLPLAFMADGHLPDRGRYGTVVSKALQFVLDNASNDEREGGINAVDLIEERLGRAGVNADGASGEEALPMGDKEGWMYLTKAEDGGNKPLHAPKKCWAVLLGGSAGRFWWAVHL